VLDVARGWGRRGETFHCRDEMARLGAETWFNLGDRDLGTHLARTQALRSGRRLSDVTTEIAERLGVAVRIVPATNESIRTRVLTPEGWLSFQEYFVRERARPKVLDVTFDGALAARPAPGVVDAIASADVVVVCPSNPITSIGPILAVPGVVDALETSRARVVAVSPIVGGAAVSGPAGELMRARGLPVSPVGVALAYAPWLDALVIETRDADHIGKIGGLGVRAIATGTLMTDAAREIALARVVLEAVR
jgi:LPPG:FO 2-phospho-L-lactate transferase